MGNGLSSPSINSTSEFNLLALPLELRRRVYEYALPASIQPRTGEAGDEWPIHYEDEEDGRGPLPMQLYEWRRGVNLALLRVCKQLHRECSDVFSKTKYSTSW